jgi:lipopolysaccharide biosynthesis glycosyltransferase
MKEVTPITIVVACDDHYMILTAALLKSIEMNHSTGEPIEVYIVEDNVSSRNKNRLLSSVGSSMLLYWIKMSEAIPEGMSLPVVNNTYPLNTFIRLFIPHFIPQHIKKVIFMDVDMIVLGDISKLWHTDIGDHIIGAVTDSITKTLGNGIANYEQLRLNPASKYFNAGLQIINTDKWREQHMTEKIVNLINENRKFAALGDQYGLNIGLAEQWQEIDPLWNYFSNGNHPHPYLIHYYHRKPFYKTYFNNYQEIFYEYLDYTAWKNTKPVGESRRYLKKISNMIPKWKLLFSR